MARLFQTGNGTSTSVTNVGLELANNVWLKSALLQALMLMCDENNWETQGDASVEFARDKSNEMYVSVLFGVINSMPAGVSMAWHTSVAPSGWLLCDGSVAFVAEYPELFDLWGYKYGGSGTQFAMPDMRNYSPMVASGGEIDLDATAGAMTHTLTLPQIPAHTHSFDRRITNGAGATFSAFPGQGTAASDGLTDAAGDGAAHNNLHPVFGVHWVVWPGKRVT